MPMLKNAQHERAVQERLKGKSEDEAYRLAGYRANRANASRMFLREDVKARLGELMGKAAERTQVTVAEVLENMARIARADLRALYNPDGSLKPMAEWPDDAALAVAAVETSDVYSGTGKDRRVTGLAHKVKLWDKTKALDLLGRHFGMLKHVVEIKTPLDKVSNDELAAFIDQLRSLLGSGDAAGTRGGTGAPDGTEPPGGISTVH